MAMMRFPMKLRATHIVREMASTRNFLNKKKTKYRLIIPVQNGMKISLKFIFFIEIISLYVLIVSKIKIKYSFDLVGLGIHIFIYAILFDFYD